MEIQRRQASVLAVMRRWIAALIVIGALLWWITGTGPAGDLRKFDPEAVAAAETAMWRSYYSRERMRLFIQLVQLLREQYRQPAPKAILTAFHAARAASTFQSGHSRAEYERALPDLVDYFSRLLPPGADLEPVARLELEWWILHRERHPRLAPALAELQAAIYSLPAEKFREHAALRAEAMIIRDRRAERGELTEEDWRQINDLLRRSWRSLHAAVNGASAGSSIAGAYPRRNFTYRTQTGDGTFTGAPT